MQKETADVRIAPAHRRSVYLDWNATTPAASRRASRRWAKPRVGVGEPSSQHRAGRAAKALVEQARGSVAALVGLSARDVIFTSGGTEANNLGSPVRSSANAAARWSRAGSSIRR